MVMLSNILLRYPSYQPYFAPYHGPHPFNPSASYPNASGWVDPNIVNQGILHRTNLRNVRDEPVDHLQDEGEALQKLKHELAEVMPSGNKYAGPVRGGAARLHRHRSLKFPSYLYRRH